MYDPGLIASTIRDGDAPALQTEHDERLRILKRRVDHVACPLAMKLIVLLDAHVGLPASWLGVMSPYSESDKDGFALHHWLCFMAIMEEDYANSPEKQIRDMAQSFIGAHPIMSTIEANLIMISNLDPLVRQNFKSSLSQTEMYSWELLRDWWDAAYSDTALSAATKTYLWADPDQADEYSLGLESNYQALLIGLWIKEFSWKQWDRTILNEGGTCEEPLISSRSRAPLFALGQKAGYLAMHAMRPNDGAFVEGHAFRYGRTLQASYDTNPWLPELQRGQGTDLNDLPLYLWDRELSQTRKTIDIVLEKTPVEYTCISHTWGRWKKETAAHLSGVDWAIPENTIFEVMDLPDILAEAPARTRFLWFDLVCLPQDDTSPDYTSEVSRQATIFYHASACIAWINQINSWRNMQECMRWLALHYLETSTEGDIYDVAPLLAHLEESIGTNTIELRKGDLDPYGVDPWLSSTWTLQESSLCPDMILCNREWQPLELVSGTTISLWQLMALSYVERLSAGGYSKHKEPSHVQAQMLPVRVAVTGPGLSLDRCAILDLGARRTCQTRRAEAVMSALGMTDWYDEYLHEHGEPPPDKNLVLGSYTLPFVREAADKMGAEFFFCVCTPYNRGIIWPPGPPYRGTFLPFGSPQNDIGLLGATGNSKFQTHSALKSWSIEADASVRVVEASVLVSSDHYPDEILNQIDPRLRARYVPEDWSSSDNPLATLFSKFIRPFRDPVEDVERLWEQLQSARLSPEAQLLGIVIAADENETVLSVLESLEEQQSGQNLWIRLFTWVIRIGLDLPEPSVLNLTVL